MIHFQRMKGKYDTYRLVPILFYMGIIKGKNMCWNYFSFPMHERKI